MEKLGLSVLVYGLAAFKSFLTGDGSLETDYLSDIWSNLQSDSTCKSEMTEKLPFAADIGKYLYY